MQYPGYHSGKVQLAEGQWFPFVVHKLVQLQDADWYFILMDVNGQKHFLHAGNYSAYQIQPGQEIWCKIDKINCTGRIYLEPKHPVYVEGEIYHFVPENSPGENQQHCVTVRVFGEKRVEVPLQANCQLDLKHIKSIQCKVKSIKKGIPILEVV